MLLVCDSSNLRFVCVCACVRVWRCGGVDMCGLVDVSVDGLCPEEGFKGVWVSRSIVVVVLVGL